jgi:dipeptidyl aminopeptidase/acylaminoacyl peptidase
MTLNPGTRLGSYEVTSTLGEGGMGEVYRARDSRLGRDVAIKVLPELFAADPERIARFEREAKTLAALNHPNIAHIHGLEVSNGVRALVMELIEGSTLADRIAQGPIPIAETLPIAKQIAEALEAAHEAGIVHRDLKPANIKVRDDGTVKVLDFGLARVMAPDGGTTAVANLSHSPTITSPAAMTGVGVLLGTAAYMSPEQVKGRVADKRCDIWAFGCVVYEMLTGKRAFRGDDVQDTLAAILRGEPDWTALPADTPTPIRRLLRRCLEKDRRRRMPDAAAARLEVEDALTAPAEIPVAAAAPPPRARWRSVAPVGAALLVGAAIAVTAMLMVGRSAPEAVVTRLEITTPATAAPFQFALSPDGRRLAFVAGTSTRQLWVRALDQVSAQPLVGTDNAAYPFWAPDSRALGFFAGGKLKRVDLTGGAPQVLADANAGGGTWNAEGVIVFGAGPARPLMRVPATGGTAVAVTHATVGQGELGPQFLPDGRHVLFYTLTPGQQQGVVSVASLDGGEPTRVVGSTAAAAYAPPGYLLRVTQGVLVAQRFDAAHASLSGDPIPVAQAVVENDGTFRSAFSVSEAGLLAHRANAGGGQRQLVWLDRTGKVLGTVGPPDENAPTSFALSPDGQHVANARSVQGNYDIWLIDVARSVATRFTFDPASEYSPVWSPDGTRVVFRSLNRRGSGPSDLFVKPANGATDEQPFLVTPQPKTPLDWSRDGRFLLYASLDPKTLSDLWVLPLTGDAKPVPIVQTAFDETQGQFSPDGHWLAYTSNESGRDEVYARPFPEAGGKWQLSTGGGSQPRWRPDGKELFYIAPDAKLMAVPIGVAPQIRALTVGAPVALFATHLANGPGISLTGYQSRALYAVAADGRFLMNVTIEADHPAPITIVQNWVAALKK